MQVSDSVECLALWLCNFLISEAHGKSPPPVRASALSSGSSSNKSYMILTKLVRGLVKTEALFKEVYFVALLRGVDPTGTKLYVANLPEDIQETVLLHAL